MDNKSKQDKIKYYELLNIPYDSSTILDIETKINFSLIGKINFNTNNTIQYIFNNINNTQTKITNLNKYIANNYKDFIPKLYYYHNVDAKNSDKYKTTITVNNTSKIKYELDSDNISRFEFNTIIQDFLTANNNNSLPTELHFDFDIELEINEEFRNKLADQRRDNQTPQQYMDKIFKPVIQEQRLRGTKSYWSNPFPRNSFKHKIYSSEKEVAIFAVEYFYGKKMPLNSTFEQIAMFLAGAPNHSFGINDIQVAKKLTEKWHSYGFKYMYSLAKEIGITPATDLSRWVKRRGLQLEVDKVN